MNAGIRAWDYLIVTASNEAQARAYKSQLAIRRELGLLSEVREAIVVADPAGRRIGSGGSTLCCLLEVLRRRLNHVKGKAGPPVWEEILRRLRILIIHAGGDSRRLPAYGPCGKIFIPVPGESDSAVCLSLFDRQLPTYLSLRYPSPMTGRSSSPRATCSCDSNPQMSVSRNPASSAWPATRNPSKRVGTACSARGKTTACACTCRNRRLPSSDAPAP